MSTGLYTPTSTGSRTQKLTKTWTGLKQSKQKVAKKQHFLLKKSPKINDLQRLKTVDHYGPFCYTMA
jgi:hypothetical protein